MDLPSSDPPGTAPLDLTGVRAGVDRARLGEPTDHWHLHAVCRTLPTDFEPYGFRVRDAPDCSCGCRWWVPLAGKLAYDWGVCTNPVSPRVGLLTFEHQGCPAFEAGPDEPAEPPAAPGAAAPRPRPEDADEDV
jgi:hypothetical protein